MSSGSGLDYRPGDGWIHRLHPVARGGAALSVILAFSLHRHGLPVSGAGCATLLLAAASGGLPVAAGLGAVRRLWVLIVAVALAQVWRGGDAPLVLAVDAVLRDAKATTLGMLGYCMGGTMALIHAALHPKRIDRLTLLAAPINFHDDGVLSQWARKESFPVDRVVEVLGQMDKMMLQTSFQWLKPLSQLQKLKNLYEGAANPKMVSSFVHLESWLNDNVCVPGQAYREYVTTCYHDNALVNGTLKVNDRPVSLTQVTCPMLNVMAKKDHIVPVESSRIVSTLVSGPVTEVLIDAGHIGVAMGSKAREMFTQVAGFHDRPPAAQADKTTDEPTAGPKKEKRSRR